MTDQITTSQHTQKTTSVLQIYFALLIIGGLLTLWNLLLIPSEGKNAILFGLSVERIVMVSLIFIVILGAGGMLLFSWLRKPWFDAFSQKLTKIIQPDKTWGWCILLLVIGLLGGSFLILLIPEITEPFTAAIFERLQPFLVWFAVICTQTLVGLHLLRYGSNLSGLKPKTRTPYSIAIILSGLLILWLLIALTGLGVTASDAGAGWYYLGRAITEVQVLFAWGVGMVYIGLAIWTENHIEFLVRIRRFRFVRIDLLFSFLLWLTANLIWNSAPLLPNWFASLPQPPNNVFYPSSDAITYDTTGQTLLIGEGFKTHNHPFASRPMYTFFLATLHAIGGVDYEPIIWMQVAVLALMPVILYWITRHLHNRVSALIAALLLIFREGNSIILGDTIAASHAKLLMADLPTSLGVMLFVLLIIRWLQNPSRRQTLALIAGGVTGAFMLIRPEFGILLPFIGFAALLDLIRQPKIWFKGMLLIAAGTILMLAPWVWRNYQITGTIFLDSPHYRANLFAQRYSEDSPEPPQTTVTPNDDDITQSEKPPIPQTTPTQTAVQQPSESDSEFVERIGQDSVAFVKDNPDQVAFFITNHFLNNQIQSVLYLPMTFRLPESLVGFLGHKQLDKFWAECCSVENYVRKLPFWFKWEGNLPQQSIIPLLINLMFISIGLASVWRRQRFIGLVPIAAIIGYSLINALVRNSGGRYSLPVSWIGIFYFAVGLGEFSIWMIAYFRGSQLTEKSLGELGSQGSGRSTPRKAAILWTAAIIFLLGCLLPLIEIISTPRYSPKLLSSQYDGILQSTELSLAERETITAWQQSGGLVTQGRALYPIFYAEGNSKPGGKISKSLPWLYPRVEFYLVGPNYQAVVLPQETTPEYFPTGADILVIGCPGNGYLDAFIIVVYDDVGEPISILRREPISEEMGCPLASP